MVKFLGNCIYLKDRLIQDMVGNAEEVDYQNVEQIVGREYLQRIFPLYDWEQGEGLMLKDDPYVGYYKGYYDKIPVVFVTYSGIEHVWRI